MLSLSIGKFIFFAFFRIIILSFLLIKSNLQLIPFSNKHLIIYKIISLLYGFRAPPKLTKLIVLFIENE